MPKHNNTRNKESGNNISQVFDSKPQQESKQTQIIQCTNCDNMERLKGFDKYYTNDHCRKKAIVYYKYKVAIKASVWSTGTKTFILFCSYKF